MVTFPVLQWIEQDPGVDPSGSRHLLNTGFIKQLNTGAGGQLNFGDLPLTAGQQITETKLCYARAANMGTASGIFNMKFYLSSVSDWGGGTYRFLEHKTQDFVPSLSLTASDDDTPTTIPAQANLLGTVHEDSGFPRGQPWISGVLDQDVSEYVYLAILANNDVNPGIYGGAGAGSFRYALIYDFS